MDAGAVAVAQLVEPRVVIPVVAGSIPVRHLRDAGRFSATGTVVIVAENENERIVVFGEELRLDPPLPELLVSPPSATSRSFAIAGATCSRPGSGST